MRHRYARAVTKARYPLIAFWVAAAVITTLTLPSIDEAQVGALGDLVPHNADAIKAEKRSHELFGFPLLSRTVVVQRNPHGLSVDAQARVLSRAVALNRGEYPGLTGIAGAIPATNAVGKPPFSREHSTTALTFLFFRPDIGPIGQAGLTKRLEMREISAPGDSLVGDTGAISARQEQASLVKGALPIVELATVLLVLLAVGLHFRSVVAPLVNLIAVAISYLISIRLVAWIGENVGVSVPREVTPLIVVLLFGVITDYSIFYLSRFRLLLAQGLDSTTAAERSSREIGPIVLAAGLSVVLASSALLVAELGFLQAFGPGMALAVLIGLVVSLTLLPALLAVGGANVFWPLRPGRELAVGELEDGIADEKHARRGRTHAVHAASNHPVAVVLGCLVVLLAAASGLTGLKVGNPLVRGLPDGNPHKTAYLAASQGFAAGILGPTVVIVEAPGITAQRFRLARLQRMIARQPGVAAVAGPGSVPFQVNVGATLSPTGGAARYVLVLTADPLGARAIDFVNRIKRRLPGMLKRADLPGARASVAGDTALVGETVTKTAEDIGRVAPLTIVLVLLVLAVFLRALVAPLYLVLASVLAVAAALGLTSYLFIDILGKPELTYYAPFTVAVLLVALGSDYNVFIVGRIWQEARRRPLREAVVIGGARASRPITVAGLILGMSFALLAIVPLESFREIAFAMAAGLLIDAFFVRTLFVPALIVLFGEAGGWPGRRFRPVPEVPAATAPH